MNTILLIILFVVALGSILQYMVDDESDEDFYHEERKENRKPWNRIYDDKYHDEY